MAESGPAQEEVSPIHLKQRAVLYVAPLLVCGLGLLYAYRRLLAALESFCYRKFLAALREEPEPASPEELPDDRGKAEPLLGRRRAKHLAARLAEAAFAVANYYTPMYLVCAYLIWDEYSSSFALLRETGLLDPARLRAEFEGELDLPAWWENEIGSMIGEGWGLLRAFSLLSPAALALTFLVTVYNTCRHVRQLARCGGGLNGNPGVDSTLMIIALPMIACMMAYRSVSRMWMICANSKVGSLWGVEDFQGRRTWLARLAVCQSYYTTNYMVSDVYESWALLHFANLALMVIAAERRKRGLAESHRFYQSLTSLTNQGIYLFNLTCALEAAYYLLTTSAEAFFAGPAVLAFVIKVHSIREQVEYFFLGMGTIASSAAIGNVVTVEITFEELLEDFRPSAKFWSTKILVSIAFMQSLLLYVPPLSYLSVTEKDLFYSSALCLECFGVSLLHLVAWVPGESWSPNASHS